MNTLLVREATPQQINAALLALSNSLGKSTEEVQQILATTSKIIELTKAEYEPIQQAGKWEKDAIYLVTDQSITGVVVDQHYSATSSNAQSGTAVAEAIADRVTQSQLSGALTDVTTWKYLGTYHSSEVANLPTNFSELWVVGIGEGMRYVGCFVKLYLTSSYVRFQFGASHPNGYNGMELEVKNTNVKMNWLYQNGENKTTNSHFGVYYK